MPKACQRLESTAWHVHCEDLRLQDLEGQMAQAAAQVQSLMSAVSAGALSSGGTGEATGAAAVAASASANLEVLRAGLEREANARVALGAETAEQLKQRLGRGSARFGELVRRFGADLRLLLLVS